MGRLPHPAIELETKEKAPNVECFRRWVHLEFIHRYRFCLTAPEPHAYAEVRAVLSTRYPLASYTRIVPQKSTIRVWSFYKFY